MVQYLRPHFETWLFSHHVFFLFSLPFFATLNVCITRGVPLFTAEQVVDKVEDGVVQLTKAEEYQKSARPRWCIAFLLFFISILMVLLVLKHRPKDKSEDDDKLDDAYDDAHSSSGSTDSNNSLTGGLARMLRGRVASELEFQRHF